jgi:subtilisin-like proprotein convertase family protein
MKKLFLLIGMLATASAVQATTYTSLWTVNAAIPDNNYSGWANTETFDNSPAPDATIADLSVTLNLSGGWNGDLFAYLVNANGGYVVLLDRVGMGVGGVSSLGYGDAGMTAVTLGATGTSIHSYGGGNTFSSVPTGNYLPDASGITVPGSGSLSSFFGASANTTWTLFVADMSGGGVSTVQSWGLNVTVVPEPSTLALAGLGLASLALMRRRK